MDTKCNTIQHMLREHTYTLFECVRAECLKIFHAKIFVITVLASVFMPIMAGFVMFIMKNPELSRNIGLLGKEGQLQGTADWISYLALLGKMFPFGMFIIGFGFVVSFIFGREYTDHTAKDLLTLPISRQDIVISKFVTTMIWGLILFSMACMLVIPIGLFVGLPGFAFAGIGHSFLILFKAALLGLLMVTPTAVLASYSKGYLAPLGFIVFVIILGNFIASLGYAGYYPWAIPGVYVQQALAGEHLQPASFIIIGMTSALGLIATWAWWRYADQN